VLVSTDVFIGAFAGKPSTTVRPLVSCDNQNSDAMNDPEEISTHTSMATKYHPSTKSGTFSESGIAGVTS
jgi:hypothetical protein